MLAKRDCWRSSESSTRFMSPTSTIVVFLFIGFIVFITMAGELSQYQAAIFGVQGVQ